MSRNKESIIELFMEKPCYLNMGAGKLSQRFKCDKELIYQCKQIVRSKIETTESTNNLKLEKNIQKYRDLNRINNKEKRELFRVVNALEEMNESLIEQLNEISFNIQTPIPEIRNVGTVAIVQISDAHFNELVDLPNNQYDFIIASKRLQKYAYEIKQQCSIKKIKKIVIAMTGDMINSDRRLDEKLSMSTNRTKATLIAVSLLEHFILDLATIAPIDILYVTGNESRVLDEYGFSDLVITDNYDVIIFNMLRLLFRQSKYINFIESNPVETVLSINGTNILMFHGTTVGVDSQKSIQQIIGKYSAKGIVIDYSIFGHVHFANVTDLYARSGSLVGNNVYSDYGINLVTKPSQNLHFISEQKEIQNIRIELLNVDLFKGYPIEDDVEAYNAKSASKLYRIHNIIEIIN